ncbi:MAG: acyl-CoA dehydrogenase family protein [Alphaproteobacteria bacterium]|nr:acyl-CoA dehydrogenase family protein [Alphaproteobacteria bacterium]
MNTTVTQIREPDAFARLEALLPHFAARAAHHDRTDEFVGENFAALREAGLMSAAVPRELGGDGLDARGLSPLLGLMARACSSTALAYAMHSHVVALAAWRWRHQQAPVEPMLRRVAQEQITLISSGGSDWLESSGIARRVDGGFAIEAVKGFASGLPAGTLLNTSAVYDDPEAGPTVLHFMVPLSDPHVTIEPTWQAMGMRGTGSHQVRIAGFFLPDGAVAGRRPRGLWHPLFHMVSMIAIPIIYAVYLGVAEGLRDEALAAAKRRPATRAQIQLLGSLETELAAARFAHADMLFASGGQPGPATTNRVFLGRTNMVRALMATAERAFDVAHGAAYMRTGPIERLFRDLQAARFHPLQPHLQQEIAGRMALGLDLDSPVS